MSLRDRLVDTHLPERTVPLSPARPGADPYLVTVRALPAPDWDALVQLHPPTPAQAAGGWSWNLATFRPALLAACVVSPADLDKPLDEHEWAQLLLKMPSGDRDRLYATAIAVNDNDWPDDATGKDSG